IPKARAGFVALILHSLAASYAENLTSLEELAQQSFDSIYVVGGGSQNELLSQLTANYSGKRVICGPVEATAIGNLVVQMQAAALIPAGLEQARKVIANSFQQKTYEPEG
ncbi:FGGY-family carbohydrate kinase, partial [Aquiluna sp.]